MSDLVISLNENTLKVTALSTNDVSGFTTEVPSEIVADTKILNPEAFSEFLTSSVDQSLQKKVKSFGLNFLVEPSDVILMFVSVNKKDGDIDEQILGYVRSKLSPEQAQLENYYFTYKKIAPFIYQFIAIEKARIEDYISVASTLGVSLKSVIPWVLLLPKLVNDNEPSIFVTKYGDNNLVALAELNGIYFTEVYENEKTQEELAQLVENLSIYKRPVPINHIYTVNFGSFTLNPDYQVLPLNLDESDFEEAEAYIINLLFEKSLERNPEILSTQVNLLNALPVPVVTDPKVPAKTAVAIAIPVLMVLATGFFFFREDISSKFSGGLPSVLSGSDNGQVVENQGQEVQENEAEENSQVQNANGNAEAIEEIAQLHKEDLVIMIENGGGVAGLAGDTRDYLKNQDFEIFDIGNAAISDRERTLVQFKESFVDYKNMLEDAMKDRYDLEFSDDYLEETSDYNVLITVGSTVFE